MKRLVLLTAILLIAGTAFAAEGEGLSDKLFSPDRLRLGLMSSGLPEFSGLDFKAAETGIATAGNLNPGKAMLLSAIIPGAGEYYAGKKLKAAIFLAVEVAAWYGVISYYNKGKDKEDEFMAFADSNFVETRYREMEFDLARSQAWGDSGAYMGTIEEWTDLSWDEKIHYIPNQGFTHELPTATERDNSWNDKQQYYEMIGKYLHQFGFGWLDAFGDDPGTPFFDGESPRSVTYMDMRHDSNQLLKTSAWGYNIALLNHIASALDASFTVRLMNREAKAELGFRQVRYDREVAPVGGLTITW